MTKKYFRRIGILSLSLASLLGVFAIVMPMIGRAEQSAVAITSRTLDVQVQAGFTSPVVNPGVTFNAIAATWSGTEESELKVRFRSHGQWSDWIPITSDEDAGAKLNGDARHYSNLLDVLPADRVQYTVNTTQALPSSVQFFFIDTIQEPSWYESLFQWLVPHTEAQDLDVISRSEWGADESLRFNNGQEEWPPEYEAPKAFILHHTAGSNGQPDLEQAKAVIRSIYYYHTVIRGWGDIGYNYLVDTTGHIFEGRYGGDGVVGAHTYRGAECTSKGAEQSYNRGSIGVALLGNYENVDYVSAQAKAAISHFIAVKGRALGIVPNSDVFFMDRTLPTIFGHGDVDCTTCPGARYTSQFADIRSAARAEYNTLPDPNGAPRASLRGQSDNTVATGEGVSLELWVDMRNDGTSDWTRFGTAPELKPANDAAHLLRASNWDGDIAGVIEDSPIHPGQTVRYHFTVTAPTGHSALQAKFALFHDGQQLSGTSATINFTITSSPYAAHLQENGFPEAMLQSDTATVTMKYANAGRAAWQRNEFSLVVRDPGGGDSVYDVHSASGENVIPLDNGPIQPGQSGNFTISLRSPNTIGRYTQEIVLLRNGQEVAGSKVVVHSRVDSPSQAALVSQTIPVAMLNTWRIPVTVKFENTGVTTWDRSIVLKVMNDDHGPSSFYDGSWPGAVGEIRMQESQVRPGETATYRFYMRAPVVPRVYVQNMQLIDIDGGADTIQHPIFDPLIRVDAANTPLNPGEYHAEKVSETIPPAIRVPWRIPVTVRYRNTGTKTWDSGTRLNVYGALFRRPEFRDTSWARQTGGIPMNEARVAPGQVASFTFRMDAPDERQVYEILFQLSANNNERSIVPGSYFSELIRVDP